eukprot:SAG22_NODE_536_length_9364_cov_15.973988_16_plen_65_part_00
MASQHTPNVGQTPDRMVLLYSRRGCACLPACRVVCLSVVLSVVLFVVLSVVVFIALLHAPGSCP